MAETQQPFDAGVRRKRLEELFEDTPYLSPTMKARSLHEKLERVQAPPQAAPDLLEQAGAPSAPSSGAPLPSGAPTAPPRAEGKMGLAEAAAYIRDAHDPQQKEPAGVERLQRFRDQVLRKWLPGAPPKEKNG